MYPTSMVLDLGCTRAMTSRVAANSLMKFLDENVNLGLWYRIEETSSQFSFANSEQARCKEEIIICTYDYSWQVQSTEFDIVEQGHAPFLMSLPQMKNLQFTFDLKPNKTTLSSKLLGIRSMELNTSRS